MNEYQKPAAPERLCIPEGIDARTRALIATAIEDEDVVASVLFCEQIGHLCNILRPEGSGVSFETIGKMFTPNKSHAAVNRHFKNFNKEHKPAGRPEILSKDQYDTS